MQFNDPNSGVKIDTPKKWSQHSSNTIFCGKEGGILKQSCPLSKCIKTFRKSEA